MPRQLLGNLRMDAKFSEGGKVSMADIMFGIVSHAKAGTMMYPPRGLGTWTDRAPHFIAANKNIGDIGSLLQQSTLDGAADIPFNYRLAKFEGSHEEIREGEVPSAVLGFRRSENAVLRKPRTADTSDEAII